ncbi:hypothetical protein MY8738_008259 [Beauveria namnaoensis]
MRYTNTDHVAVEAQKSEALSVGHIGGSAYNDSVSSKPITDFFDMGGNCFPIVVFWKLCYINKVFRSRVQYQIRFAGMVNTDNPHPLAPARQLHCEVSQAAASPGNDNPLASSRLASLQGRQDGDSSAKHRCRLC